MSALLRVRLNFWGLLAGTATPDVGSDHYPLVVDFAWAPAPSP